MSKQVGVYLSDEAYAKAKEEADNAGVSLSSWVVQSVLYRLQGASYLEHQETDTGRTRAYNKGLLGKLYLPELDMLYRYCLMNPDRLHLSKEVEGRAAKLGDTKRRAYASVKLREDNLDGFLYIRKEMLSSLFGFDKNLPAKVFFPPSLDNADASKRYQKVDPRWDYRCLGNATRHVVNLAKYPDEAGVAIGSLCNGPTYVVEFAMDAPLSNEVYDNTLEHYDNLTKRGLIWHRPFSREDLVMAMDAKQKSPGFMPLVWVAGFATTAKPEEHYIKTMSYGVRLEDKWDTSVWKRVSIETHDVQERKNWVAVRMRDE